MILKYMIHWLSGAHNFSAVCTNRSQYCTSGFPKQFRNEAGCTKSDYNVMYERWSSLQRGLSAGWSTRVDWSHKTFVIDKFRAVPHCPSHLRKVSFHMNVEPGISRFGDIEYFFKYLCNGSDRVTMQLLPQSTTYNEIDQFQDSRYVSTLKAE